MGATPRVEGWNDFGEGRDPRKLVLLQAARQVAEAEDAFAKAAADLERARAERKAAYAEMIGQTILTEGAILRHKDSSGQTLRVLGSGGTGYNHNYQDMVTIAGVDPEGVWVKRQDGSQVLLDINTIHHPQAALPEADI